MRPGVAEATGLPAAGAAALLVTASLTIMVGCVLAPALPQIAAGLGVPRLASWLITLPSLGVVLFSPFAGRIIAGAGAHRALWVGSLIYGLLGMIGAVLHGMVAVLADRLLLGAATAVVMSSGTVLIAEFYQGDARLNMIARQGMAIELGGVVFLFGGGVLAAWRWQGPFLLYAVAWIALALVYRFVPAGSRAGTIEDTAGPSPAGSVRALAVPYLGAVTAMTVFTTAVIALPLRLQGLGFSTTQTGLFLSFISLVAVCFAFLMPRAERQLGGEWTLTLAFGCYALAHLLVFVAVSPLQMILAGGLMGCGFGLSVPLVNHMTIQRCSPHRRGHALAYLSMALFLGQFLSTFVAAGRMLHGPAFLAAALLAGVAAVVLAGTVLLRGRESRPSTQA